MQPIGSRLVSRAVKRGPRRVTGAESGFDGIGLDGAAKLSTVPVPGWLAESGG